MARGRLQCQSGAIASAEVILADQTVVNPTEAGRHLTSPIRTEEVFAYHNVCVVRFYLVPGI